MKARLKVGDLVKNIHALYPAGMGIIIKVSSLNRCPYKVHWFDGYEPAWMRASWLEIPNG